MRFILALVIGIATAWWIWGRLARGSGYGSSDGDGYPDSGSGPTEPSSPPPPPPPPQPEAAELQPEPVVEAEPVAATAAAAAAGAAAVAASDESGEETAKPKIAAAVGEPDDLTRIKGIGPKLNDLCHSLGVLRFDQIAKWKKADVAEVDQYLKIKGRIDRDEWVAQAKLLAKGDDEGHKAKYG